MAKQRRRQPESLPEDIPRASHPPQFHRQLPVALAAIQPLVWLHFSLLDFSAQEPLLPKKTKPFRSPKKLHTEDGEVTSPGFI